MTKTNAKRPAVELGMPFARWSSERPVKVAELI
jgi:hypothetical protein